MIAAEPRRMKMMYLILGLVFVLSVGIIFTSSKKEPEMTEESLGFTIQTPGEEEVIDAISLWNAFLANEESSNLAYKDKVLHVRGVVKQISSQRNKKKQGCYIILSKSKLDSSFISGIQCQFQGNISEVAPNIKKGDTVTISGRCIGKVINVFLEDCVMGNQSLIEKPIVPRDPLLVIVPPKEGEIIDAAKLWSDYQKGLLEADKVYNNQLLKVKGSVLSFGPPRFWRGNTSFIILEADLTSNSSLKGVQCEFFGNVLTDLPNLKKGDIITIQGICSSRFFNVFLKKCTVVNSGDGVVDIP